MITWLQIDPENSEIKQHDPLTQVAGKHASGPWVFLRVEKTTRLVELKSESLRSMKTAMGLLCVRESSSARHAAPNPVLPDDPPSVPLPTLQYPPPLVSYL